MEVLACSVVQRTGESDCPQQTSGNAYIYTGESNCIGQETQTQVGASEMVKDLTITHQFIMQKMAIGILDILDKFHAEALNETARNAMVLKEFALEACRCTGFTDLGRMLLKLQSMILPCYFKSEWMQHSLQSWIQRCETAQTADMVEILKEELNESIIWKEVNALFGATVQPALSYEWKTWKHDVIKWFPTSHPPYNGGDPEQRSNDDPLSVSLQVSRKRPKLEVRRADVNSTQHDTKDLEEAVTVEIDSDFFNSRVAVNDIALASDPCIVEDIREGVAPSDSPGNVADKWGELLVEAGNSDAKEAKDVKMTTANELVAIRSVDTGSKNRQCVAFIESKGRQCVRWANEGDVYCCVHLASRFNNSARPDGISATSSQMCEGTTVLGTRCKHHALHGSSFCKKHRPHSDTDQISTFPENTHKRKHEEVIPVSGTLNCKDMVLMGDGERPTMGAGFNNEASSLIKRPENFTRDSTVSQAVKCIGFFPHDRSDACPESPNKYSLYCEKHLPSWLKRARNGKSRVISKEVFLDLLKDCCFQEQKLHLHQACELFYKLLKSISSLRNPVPKEVQFKWALSEASRDCNVGKLFFKLVNSEKERLVRIWGFSSTDNSHVSSVMEEQALVHSGIDGGHNGEKAIKCKICSEGFSDNKTLGNHWMGNHKKEAQWLFRGYACAICLDSFTNKKVLESHVQERHHVQFVEQCLLLRCMPCGSHFGNSDELWLHVLSAHPADFQPSQDAQQQNFSPGEEAVKRVELGNSVYIESNAENVCSFRKFICKFCGLKFDLLPDLGRHHQAAHMGPSMVSSRPSKRGVRYQAYRLKSGRLSRPKFKKGLVTASYSIRSKRVASLTKRIQEAKSISVGGLTSQPIATEAATLGRLEESHCSAIAKILFSDSRKTKPRPSNGDVLSVARSACCKFSLKAALEEKYGVLPDHLYLKAAKLCSEQNIQVAWHQDCFICPQGCTPPNDLHSLSPLKSLADCSVKYQWALSTVPENDEWEVDECHYVLNSGHLAKGPLRKAIVICDDISSGQEPVPVACVIDEGLSDSSNVLALTYSPQDSMQCMPWESFTYITKPILDCSLASDMENWQLGCVCSSSACCPETCDHVYLFDNDYEDAKDIYGISMRGRFPYDENRRNILEEGYLVYECNHMCSCSRNCQNRVLQNGVCVRLEVFKNDKKEWRVRAGEAILRGTFICEFIGEILDDQEASRRLKRYCEEGNNYFYHVDSHNNDASRLIGSQIQYVIDATRYGNVSRFISHSCSPNLVSYQVLIESMECQRAHIGLYASRDIVPGEELTCSYRNKPSSGGGY